MADDLSGLSLAEFAVPPCSGFHPCTSTAMSPASVDVSIRFIVGMSVRAMRSLRKVQTLFAALTIQPVRNWLKMLRIYAASHPALVIKFEAVWDRTNKSTIRKNVSAYRLAVAPKAAVSIATPSTEPKPASTVRLGRYFVPEKIKRRRILTGHVTPSQSQSSGLLRCYNISQPSFILQREAAWQTI